MRKQDLEIKKEYQDLEIKLLDPEVISNPQKYSSLNQRLSELKPIYHVIVDLSQVEDGINEATEAMQAGDEELYAVAEEQLTDLAKSKKSLEDELYLLLANQDPNNSKNAIIEIRAGAGGDESALFAADLFRMYSRFAENMGWKTIILSTNRIGIGGFKEVIFEIKANGAFGTMKYESGVHRVQRVPETEKAGRIHTSTATVAVLPEAEEVDLKICKALSLF